MAGSDPTTLLWKRDPFPQILASWLQKLPPSGWEGNIFELQIALNNSAMRHSIYAFVPSQNALGVRIRAEKAVIEAHGFELVSLRTAKQRAIRIAPKAAKE
jgi:hypothetical protein